MKRKTVLIIAVLAAVLLAGSIGGIALAQTGVTDNATTTTGKTLLGRVAAILGIDQQKLENAVAQARDEQQAAALDSYLAKLVEKGTITQAQADQYKQWWQSRPDTSALQEQLREWQANRPDVPLGDGPGGRFHMGGGFNGMMGIGPGGCW